MSVLVALNVAFLLVLLILVRQNRIDSRNRAEQLAEWIETSDQRLAEVIARIEAELLGGKP